MPKMKICPSCGSGNLKELKRNWTGKFRNQTYTVPDLEFHECEDCGEKIYDPQAMRKIEEYSPAFSGRQRGRLTA